MKISRIIGAALLSGLCLVAPAKGGGPDNGWVRSSVSLGVGYRNPIGDWRKSPVTSSHNLIGPAAAFSLDLELAIGRHWTLGVEAAYSGLNGSEWEEFVLRKGDTVDVSGEFLHFALLLRPHIKADAPDIIRFEVGPALLLSTGEESLANHTYPYTFLQDMSVGAQAGVEYIRVLSQALGASLRVTGLFFPSALQYAGGRTRSAMSLTVGAGIRFLL